MYIRSNRGVLSFGCSAVIPVVLLLQVQEFRPSEKKGVAVRDYVVRGDGVTDDTAALQRTFKAGGVNGATVYLPCGTYLITAGLEVRTSNAAIHGSGDCTILKVGGRNSFVALTITGRGLSRDR
ncbi:MAG TPA: glycosyl hydrolase family 28-related protein [Terriglobales bacterium]|nr:glycosyl hydrolase family 28-related protein [Terriglobales bacterium]